MKILTIVWFLAQVAVLILCTGYVTMWPWWALLMPTAIAGAILGGGELIDVLTVAADDDWWDD